MPELTHCAGFRRPASALNKAGAFNKKEFAA